MGKLKQVVANQLKANQLKPVKACHVKIIILLCFQQFQTHLISDQSKVSAITAMPAQTCKKQVQSFIGMINYRSKFAAQLAELAQPIRELSKENVPFN